MVFDNDGLLLDTESVWTRAEQDLFELRGLEFTPADKLELVGTSAEIAGGILERRLGEPGRAAELIEELNELVVAELEHGVEAMVGARELLDAPAASSACRSDWSRTRRCASSAARSSSPGSSTTSTSSSAPTRLRRRSPPPTPTWRPAGGWGLSRAPGRRPGGFADRRRRRPRRRPHRDRHSFGGGSALDEAHHLAESLLDEVVAQRLSL